MIILQPEMFYKEETFNQFINELDDYPHMVVDDFDFVEKQSKKMQLLDTSKPCVFLHSLSLYRANPAFINQFLPGTFFNFEEYSFTRLASVIPRELLVNADYQIKTLGGLVQDFPFGGFFIKPDNGNKLFTGDVFDQTTFLREFKSRINDYHKFMIIAHPKNILSEFRFHIVGKKIVSQAFYTYSENWENYNQEHRGWAREFMDYVLVNYDLCELLNKPALVVDVAVVEGDLGPELGIVEHNCFSTSGIYPEADCRGIIEGMKELLLKEN